MSRLDLLTPEQRDVVSAVGTSFCVSSGAGCGKTRVLVDRYVHMLEQDLGLRLDRLAAITFTENAAAQMRGRIRDVCRNCVDAARAAADARLVRLWQQRYWDVDTAPIDTIHGFCAGLLRRWPIEAGVDPNFSLLDEVDSALLVDDVVRGTLEALVGAEDAGTLEMLRHFTLGEARGLLADTAREQREVLARVAGPALARSDDEIVADLRKAIGQEARQAIEAALARPDVRAAADTLRQMSGQAPDRIEQARAAALEHLDRLGRARTPEAALEAARALVEAAGLRGGSAKLWPSKEALQAAKDAIKAVREPLTRVLEDLQPVDEETERRHLALARAVHATAGRVIEAYQAAKAARSALDFEDLQIRARNLLRDQPRVREACRSRFRSILVDELQDTNFLQFEIVELLTEPPAPRGRKPKPAGGALFAVGDPKQSIYRFRGAEVEVFEAARERVGAAGRRGLTASWRLHEGLAAMVNLVFDPLMGEAYEPVHGRHRQVNEAVGECLVVLQPEDGEQLGSAEGHAEEARQLAARLEELVREEGAHVWDTSLGKARPVRYGDVAILLRATTHLHVYEQALERQGVPYYVVAGRGFFKQQEVLDAGSLLRVLIDPSDDLHLAGVLRSPMFAVSDEGLLRLRRLGGSLHGALGRLDEAPGLEAQDRRGAERAARSLGAWAAMKDRAPLAILLERVLFASGYAASVVGRFAGERGYANLRKMVDLARRFEGAGPSGLGDYVDYVSDFVRNQMRAEQASLEDPGGETVRLMTIHKAKGLEFPVVVVPDIGWQRRGRSSACLVSPLTGLAVRLRDEDGERVRSAAGVLARRRERRADAEESLRVLYVAMTRAKDYLIFSTHLRPEQTNHSREGLLCGPDVRYNTGSESTWASIVFSALGADPRSGNSMVSLPSGHTFLVRAGPPTGDMVRHDRHRVGPRGVFVGGRVDWDVLGRKAASRADLSAVTPPAAPARPPRHVTATALAAYHHCPWRYQAETVLGMASCGPEEASGNTGLSVRDLGLLRHRALELATSDSDEAIHAAAEGALREAPPGATTKCDALRRDLVHTVEAFWTSDVGRRVAGAVCVYRELVVSVAVDAVRVDGVVDLLFEAADGSWELVDYKSGAPPDPAAAAARYELQLGLYALASERTGRPVSRRTVYFMDAAKPDTREFGAADLESAVGAARDALRGIAAEQYTPAMSETCPTCRFQTLCPARESAPRGKPKSRGDEP